MYELGLANLFIVKNATAIPQERITDTRLNSERCGIVACVLGDTDTTAYFTQLQAAVAAFTQQQAAAFTAWFSSLQSTLTENTAGNLMTLINRYRAGRTTVTLPAAGWQAVTGGYAQTASVSSVPENCVLLAAPVEASREAYLAADVHVSAASAGSVSFLSANLPTAALTVNLAVWGVES